VLTRGSGSHVEFVYSGNLDFYWERGKFCYSMCFTCGIPCANLAGISIEMVGKNMNESEAYIGFCSLGY